MADKFKFNPFTGKFDITNTGIDLQFVTSDPLTGDEGSQILNTVDHQLKMMYTGEWQLIKQLKGLDYLKLQNGSFILLQNGSKFKQQVSI